MDEQGVKRAVSRSQSPTPLDGAHCNTLLLARCSVRQRLNHASSVQFSYVALQAPLIASEKYAKTARTLHALSTLCGVEITLNLCHSWRGASYC